MLCLSVCLSVAPTSQFDSYLNLLFSLCVRRLRGLDRIRGTGLDLPASRSIFSSFFL